MSRQTSRTGGNNNWRKAKYKLDAVAAARPGRLASRQPTRGETGTLFTEGSAVTRDLYKAPPDYDTPAMKRFRDYLEETKLEDKFKQLVFLLFNRPELPYNPYPGFVQRFRQNAEAFHMDQDSDSKIQHLLRNNIKESFMPNLFTVRGYEMVWGLSSIMQAVSPQRLAKYKWLVDNMTPQQTDLYSMDDYTNQVTVALVGPCIFEGTFYSHVYNVQLRKEFLISGEDVQQGISIFVNSVMTEIDNMCTNPIHLILGVNIPYSIGEETAKVTSFDFWDPDRIQDNKTELLQAMSDTVINNRYIYLECIFRVDKDFMNYMRGQIQYCLNFIETSQDTVSSEGLSSFAEFPMASLHQGVFLTRSHAESYLAIFTPQIERFDDRDPSPPGSPNDGNKMTVGEIPSTSRLPTAQSNRSFSRAQKSDLGVVRRHIHDRLKHLHPHKVRIDGFRLGDERSTGPFAWQITTPLKSYLQQKIASHHLYTEMFDSCYCAILLLLLERHVFDPWLEVELYRLLHGTAGRLYNAMEQNKSLRFIIKGFANVNETSVVKEHLGRYRETILHLFESDLNVRSSEQITVGKTILSHVDDLMVDGILSSGPHVQMALKILKNLNWYCLTLMIQLVEDSVPKVPAFREFVGTMQQNFPEMIPHPMTRHRTRPDPRGNDMDTDVVHGMEDEHIKNHERYVIDVEMCMEKDITIPKAISKEGVLLKYVVDSHLDQIWHDFLLNLATRDHLPPNPYPLIVSTFRQAAMRMDLFFEKDDILAEKLWSAENMKVADEENFVYYIPGVDCHGTFSSLALLDTGPYVQLSDSIRKFEQKNYIQRKGPYRVAICMAISGPSILYGKMQPYLNEVELHEHIYIKGPPGCQGEAIQLFATIDSFSMMVLLRAEHPLTAQVICRWMHDMCLCMQHMSEMIQDGKIPVMGVYFGDFLIRWTWEEVLTKKVGFLTECAAVCANKEAIFMKAFLLVDQWRYVPVRKYFLLHFLSDDDIDAEIFYPDNPVAFYQSIFLTKDRAAFHYQNGGPKSGGNPMSPSNIRATEQFLDQMLADAKKRGDWLTVHKGLMLKSLLNKNKQHLPESWRMLHSIAATVEYLISMVETLQDIVQLFMEYIYFNKARNESIPKTPESKGKKSKGKSPSKVSRDSRSELDGPLDEAHFGRMVMIFHEKLKEMCSSRISLVGYQLGDFLLAKLKTAVEEDTELYNFYLAYEEQTLYRLEEIKQMLKMIQDTTSSDVHDACPLAKAVMDNIETDSGIPVRPISVASNKLNNPNTYRRTLAPQMMTILE